MYQQTTVRKFKKYLILIIFITLHNCGTPGVALLSPAITGAKTKSAHQASLSFASSLSSNQIIKKHGQKIFHEAKKKREMIFEYLNKFHLENL